MRMRRAVQAALINNAGSVAAATNIGDPVQVGTHFTAANTNALVITVPGGGIPAGATVFFACHLGSNVTITNVADEDVADWDAATGEYSSYAVSSDKLYLGSRYLTDGLTAASSITITKSSSARGHVLCWYVTGLNSTPQSVLSTGSTGSDGSPTNTITPATTDEIILTATLSVFGVADVLTPDAAFSGLYSVSDNSRIDATWKKVSSTSAVTINETLTTSGSPSTRVWMKRSRSMKA